MENTSPKGFSGENLRGVEIKMIKFLSKQYRNKDIAEELGISIRTVENYKRDLLKKTKSKNTVGLVLYGLKKGICKL